MPPPKLQRLRIELDVVIALGSNLGDRERALRDAVAAIGALPDVVLTGASNIVESTAVTDHGLDAAAPRYLNAVVTVRSALTPEALLDQLNRIERHLGRVRAERWGDRTIDLDIVTMGALIFSDARLTLPHPRAAERAFVLHPWLQLNPAARLPGEGPGTGSVAELLNGVASGGAGAGASAKADIVRVYAATALWPEVAATATATATAPAATATAPAPADGTVTPEGRS